MKSLRLIFLLIIISFFVSSCGMLLRPTSSFDRRLTARSYGKILTQSNPDCENCTDRFLVQRADGDVITLVIKYDGRIRIFE